MRRFLPTMLTALLVPAAVLGTAWPAGAEPAGAPAGPTGAGAVHAGGFFGPFAPGQAATTYDPALVPEGARADVTAVHGSPFGTITALRVAGLVPDREYGAHAHTQPCGDTGDAAGPHFQHEQDPVQPSVDPAYANPANEIWLDFTTDEAGHGFALSTVDWEFGERRAKSVVIHETHTHTAPGNAGTAGARPACVDVAF